MHPERTDPATAGASSPDAGSASSVEGPSADSEAEEEDGPAGDGATGADGATDADGGDAAGPMGPTTLRLSEEARAAIVEEARRRYPEECCGGLVGREDDEGSARTVVRAIPVRNERRERRERRYLVGPREVMRLEDEAEEEGLELFGFFHSHPDHPARPSEHDRRAAWPWYSYVIVSVRDGDPERIRSWRLREDRGSFDEERVTATEGATEEP